MSDSPAPHSEERAGIVYAASAYALWGVLTVYWRALDGIPALELTVHRVLWCAPFVLAITLVRGHLARVLAAVRDPRMLGALAVSGAVISVNWLIYIYGVESRQLVEISLGYYIMPLVSFAMGLALFGERISRLRAACIALAAIAVGLRVLSLGHIPWLALGLALTFSLYGYVRKRAPVAALDGLLVETTLMFPFALGLMVWWTASGTAAFPTERAPINILLVAAGPLTALPLSLFAAGARRISMTTMGFLQYLSPSITLLIAVLGFGEAFTRVDLISFGCVWAALVIVALESRFPMRAPLPSTLK